ncbi:MAG: hypothetical protein ABFS23_01085 [Pseudomonadota bacterium]
MKGQATKLGRWRLAVGLSILWLAGLYFLTEPQEQLRLFLLGGVLPVLAVWLVAWVVRGYRRERRARPGPFGWWRNRG